MIKVGDVLTIKGYDYDKMIPCKREFVLIQVYPFFVLTQHKKAGYRECFSVAELIKNGYVQNFEDVFDEAQLPRHTSHYGDGNKLLKEYHA